tara:strand:- start:12709 stop:13575 length:867 start_codon:yes stop_codon:yes gene_type:complete
MNNTDLSVCIIGHGRIGKFFESLLKSMKGVRVLVKHKHEPRYPVADIFMICVQDQWVLKVVEELTVHEQDRVFSVVHCSGILPLNVLAPLAEVNGERSRWKDHINGDKYESEFNKIAVLHPLAPINSQTVSAENILFNAIGDPELLLIFEYWCMHWGAQLLKVDAHQKKVLHTAAVMSCNYLTTLYGMVSDFLKSEQFSKVEVRQILATSMGRTLEQLDDLSVEKAMTGPIIRGDTDTIREHLSILKHDQQCLGLYKNLGNSTIDIISDFEHKPSEDIIKVMRALFSM